MDKILQLAQKLKALSEGGVDSEAVNAQQKLHELMSKHGISAAELEIEEKQQREFKVKREQKKLFFQVAVSILGAGAQYSVYKGRREKIYISCTSAEFIEISHAFSIYWASFVKESDLFFAAFVYKTEYSLLAMALSRNLKQP